MWQVCCTVFNWSVFLSWPKGGFHWTFNCFHLALQWIPCSLLLSPLSVTLFLILTILYCCEIFLGLSSHLSLPSLLAFVLWLEQWVSHLPLSFAIMPLCLLSSCSLCPFILITACMHLTPLPHCLRWLTSYFLSMYHLDLNRVLLFSLTLLHLSASTGWTKFGHGPSDQASPVENHFWRSERKMCCRTHLSQVRASCM